MTRLEVDRGGEHDDRMGLQGLTRRVFFQAVAAPLATLALSGISKAAGRLGLPSAEGEASGFAGPATDDADSATPDGAIDRVRSGALESAGSMGIAETSLTPTRIEGPVAARMVRPPVWDAYELLEKCHELGGAGIQTQLNGDLKKLRARAEQLGMWIEGMVLVPRNGDTGAFEQSLIDAKTAGATVVRTAMLGGRRYESFTKLEDWKQWVDGSRAALKLIVPLVDRHKVVLAIENHKDWTLDEMQALLKTYESEYLGCCFDFGNNIALLDDPMEMAMTLAPYVRATHVKDMAVRPYQDGFLLSEVPLGTGLLDLVGMVTTLRRANPRLRLSLEMITRDPLKVPCMTPQYWTVFPDRNGRYLARIFKVVQEHGGGGPLPTVSQLSREERVRVEEENIKVCISYAAAHLAH
jgi:sugar phosphate isomerase/epimerase